jgi:hypothetical protein
VPIDRALVEEARWGAVCPGTFTPMCMIRGKCACFRAKTVEISGHLPSRSSKKDELVVVISLFSKHVDAVNYAKKRLSVLF